MTDNVRKTGPRPGTKIDQTRRDKHPVPIVSARTPQGHIVELVWSPDKECARFAVWDGHKARVMTTYSPHDGVRYVPSRSADILVRQGVVRFADEPAEYGTAGDLLGSIRAYLDRYVDLSPGFARVAALYVLLTWVHDAFNELPYLRRRGDFGTGKTRFLIVLGAICYKPIFAGGASTVSPIFHLLDKVGGTLLIDEADFRFSDENAQIAKILNNGNMKGFSVLRSESPNGRDFRPRAFKIFGPKIVAMRGRYQDAALESRFVTETSASTPLRQDIPINLPDTLEREALGLRNRLLLYRFHTLAHVRPAEDAALDRFEPRLRQILMPLMSLAQDEADREAILHYAEEIEGNLRETRGQSLEADILTALKTAMAENEGAGVSVLTIARLHGKGFGEAGKAMSAKAMGHILRTRLNLKTRKSHGVFIVPVGEIDALTHLYARYGVTDEDVDRLRDAAGLTSRVEAIDRPDKGGQAL